MYRRTKTHNHNILEYKISGGKNEFILPKCTITSMYLTENIVNNVNLGRIVNVSFNNEKRQIKTLKLDSVNFKFGGGMINIILPPTKISGKFFCTV